MVFSLYLGNFGRTKPKND